MKKNKILFLTFWYPDEKNPVKGVFILEHARALRRTGYDVRLFACAIGHSRKLLAVDNQIFTDPEGLPTFLLTIHSAFHKGIYVAIPILRLIVYWYYKRRISTIFQPDIIHSNVLFPAAITGHYLAKRIGKPHIITEHWSKVDTFFRNNVYAKSGMVAYNNADAVTVVSEWLKNSITHRITRCEKLTVVPNVVSRNFVPDKYVPSDQIRFTVVANWEPPKNISIIIDALQALATSSSRPFLLQIVGEGSLLAPVLAVKGNLQFSIHHFGFQSKVQIVKIFEHTDYFLHCSQIETFSIVIAEALCAGIPVVASKVGAIPELISPDNGVMCGNSVVEWAEAIKIAMSTPFDRTQISNSALQRFSPYAVAGKFQEIYERVLQAGQ